VLSFGLYDGVLAEAIHHLKFHGRKRLSVPLGTMMLALDIPRADGIVPVPLTRASLIKRGFNQSLLIARVIARELGIPLRMDSLHKKRETLPQVGLSATERRTNLRGAFGVHDDIRGQQLLLVDDVMTTGATVRECAKTLVRSGAREVIVLTLARAGEP